MIKEIKSILDLECSDQDKEMRIFQAIAKNKNAVPYVLQLLNIERLENHELINDANVELSRAHLLAAKNAKNRKITKKDFGIWFVNEEIEKFYKKYKGRIDHLFYGTELGEKILINKKE